MSQNPMLQEETADAYRRAGWWLGETLGDMLKARAMRHGKKPAVIGPDRTLSYRDLDERAGRIASGFAALGVSAGDRVVVQLPNRSDFLEVVFGLTRLGAVPVLALPAHRDAEIGYVCATAEAVAYVCPSGDVYEAMARRMCEQVTSLRHVVMAGGRGDGGAATFHGLEEIRSTPVWEGAAPSSDDPAVMLLSGGSTGLPKLIPRTHDDLLHMVRAAARAANFGQSVVYLAVLPVAHSFTLCAPGVLGVLNAGGTIVFSDATASAAEAFGLITRHRITATALVPTLAKTWLSAIDSPGATAQDLSSLKVVQIGGAKADEDLARHFQRCFHRTLQQVYGMSEGLLCFTRLSDPDESIVATQGRPVDPGVELRIVDGKGLDAPAGAIGELLVRGPSVIRGYYQASEANASAFTPEGFYRTGDLVRSTASGNLMVVGRVKDQINRGGEKIDAAEVESVLRCHPDVLDAALVASPDEFLGERSHAFVVTREPLDVDVLRQYVRAKGLAEFKVPDEIDFIEELPRTPVGKIDKKPLRALAAPRQPCDNPSEAVASDSVAAVLSAWSMSLDLNHPLTPHDNFFEHGANSLLVIEAAQRIGVFLGRDVPPALVFAHPTALSLARVLDGNDTHAAPTPADLIADVSLEGTKQWPTDFQLPGPSSHPLLTGATGFVGAHLLAALLEQTSATITCTVRAETHDAARRRLATALTALGLPTADLADRVIALPADLSRTRLGLDTDDHRRLTEQTDAIYHCAAAVSTLRGYAALRAANVTATRNLLEIAATGCPAHMHHVSTLALTPPSGHPALPEAFIAPHAGLTDGYRQTKWSSERLLELAAERGLPTTVYRLGRVIGADGTAAPNPNDLVWRILRAGINLGALPALPVTEVWTPADWTANAIVHLSHRASRTEPGAVFNLAPTTDVPLATFFEWVAEYGYNTPLVAPPLWVTKLADTPGGDTELRTLLDPSQPAHEQLADLPLNRIETAELPPSLDDSPLAAAPTIDRDLIHRYLSRWIAADLLPPV
ncbi:thioester reductase domain-containing protein [Streptomyces sp. TRM66268-LWL]|uniref:Thioester reductase domain-containing protein n=1 Tax=Streptomyces polyasparticus TaxID=2767826 RepID=A0ABR7SXN3_9ACTN|nr:thioester reductase domain-containing protein [Streptomyces polyasparticus]MBC9719425.1 thioester reductase domain-containing protein [Streptomyces polyasparticus]